MGRTFTIVKKEFTDLLRDKRTILTMIVIPLIFLPILLSIVVRVTQRQEAKADRQLIDIAFVGAAFAPELRDAVLADSLLVIKPDVAEADIERMIRADSLDGGIVVPPDFLDRVGADEQAEVIVFYRSSSSFNVAERRMVDAINTLDDDIVEGRIRRRNLDPNLFDAIAVDRRDVSTLQERLGQAVGGFLPYMFVIFMFTGAMYAGIDLSAGEKERGTLETLLSSPASRLEIVRQPRQIFLPIEQGPAESSLLWITAVLLLVGAVLFGRKEYREG